jgi:hypothetical protein
MMSLAGLELTSLRIRACAGDAVSQGKEQLQPDPAVRPVVLRAASEWCSGSIAVEHAAEARLLAVYASAESWSSERWWAGASYGLRGEGTLNLELALPEFQAGLCCAMIDEWWTQPSFIPKADDVPARTQFLLWRDRAGLYGVLIPLVQGALSAELRGGSGGLELCVSSFDEGRLRVDGPVLLAGRGENPYELVQRAYARALELSGRTAKLRRAKRFPECLEYLGWCTWDAFYRDVTADKIRAQLAHFRELGLPLGFVLIDDGWYPIREQMLLSTAYDPEKFPDGLAPVVSDARQAGVRWVGVWHALTGYWSGIHPDHELQGVERASLLESKGGRIAPAFEAGKSYAFFDAWHRKLASTGVDFVKVDGQAAVHRYTRDLVPRTEGAASLQRALQASVGVHFEGQMINCMSMSQELVWCWSMSNVTRSSPDYMIHGVEADPAAHARANAYNSLWLGQLSWCDWDMFRTDQPTAAMQAALRAVSGGPIYVSDGLQTTQSDELWPLMLSDGRLLRCDEVGVPTEDWLLRDPLLTNEVFKIRNLAAHTHVIGAFNLSQARVTVAGQIDARDVGLGDQAELVIWSHQRGIGKRLAPGACYELELPVLACDVLTLAQPIRGFVPIGLASKLIPGKTIASFERSERHASCLLRDAGTLIAYSERLPVRVTVGGEPVPYSHVEHWLSIEVPIHSSRRVEFQW